MFAGILKAESTETSKKDIQHIKFLTKISELHIKLKNEKLEIEEDVKLKTG